MNLKKMFKRARKIYEKKYDEVGEKIDVAYDDFVKKYRLKNLIHRAEKKIKEQKPLKEMLRVLFLNTWAMIKSMPKKQLCARFASVSLIYTLMLPITTVTASQLIIRDGADKLTDAQETALIEQINELTSDCNIDVLIITNKKETPYDDANTYAKEELKIAYPNSECTLGVVFDFDTSSYAIVPQGTALNFITEEEIDTVFDFCDKELKKEQFSINTCCETILDTFFVSVNDTYEEEKILTEEIKEVQDASENVRTTTENVNENSAMKKNQVLIKDLADLISIEDESTLIRNVDQLFQKENCNILILTTNDMEGLTPEKYNEKYILETSDEEFDNISFIIDMDNKKLHVETTGKIEHRIDDTEKNQILDAGYAYITDESYMDCFDAMAQESIQILKDSPVETDINKSTSNFFDIYMNYIVIGFGVGLVLSIVVVVALLKRHNSANYTQPVEKYEDKSQYNVLNEGRDFVRRYETVQRDFYKTKVEDIEK